MMYQFVKSTEWSKLTRKDRDCISLAINQAEKSLFANPHKIGAVLEYKQCILHGRKST